MSWRDDLRPASFRGVRFEVRSAGTRGSRRGAHHVYPMRDRGWLEDLGLADPAFSFDAYVIGDDAMAQRAALEAALEQPGKGELIHPYRGRLMVVVDPSAGWSARESGLEGRMVRFQMSFLLADDAPSYPSTSASRAAPVAQAAALRSLAADDLAAELDLGGPAWVVDDTAAEASVAWSTVAEAEPLMEAAEASPWEERLQFAISVAELALEIAEDPEAALDLLKDAALDALVDAFVSRDTMAAARRYQSLSDRAFSLYERGKRLLKRPDGAYAAALRIIAASPIAAVPLAAGTGARIVASNRAAIQRAQRLTAIGFASEAIIQVPFAAPEAAIAEMQTLDRAFEAQIRNEADRAQPNTVLTRALTDLRASMRETMLANAANIIPVARADIGTSLPSLALSWRLTGGVAEQPDIVARNSVTHPLFGPATGVAYRAGGADV